MLEIVEKIGIVDSWIVAGTFRNYLWNVLSGKVKLDLSTDIDVAFYDKTLEYEENQRIEYRLKQDYPMYKWEVKNQFFMNKHNPNTLPYINTRDAVYYYPEKCTALAIRIINGEIEIFSPYGFDDIERFEITPTPYITMDSLRIEMYNKRQKSKSWQNKFPKLHVKMCD